MFRIIASTRMVNGKVVILGARLLNFESDDYEYVVATMENQYAQGWGSGKYFRTLPIAVNTHDEEVRLESEAIRRRHIEASLEAEKSGA
jgi:hypothetical protein